MRGTLLLTLAAACAAPAPRAPATSAAWSWTAAIDAGLTRLDVHVCSAAPLPARLLLDGATPVVVHTAGWTSRGRTLESAQPTRCLHYSVETERLPDATHAGRDLLTRPGQWLLRPERWPTGVTAELAFELPAGVRVSTPYARPGGRYLVDDSLDQRLAHVAFGRLQSQSFEVAGTTFDVVILDTPHRASTGGLEAWLRGAAEAVTELFPTFPASHVQVIVRPVPSSDGPVVFGLTTRGGGAGLLLLLAADAGDHELLGEWVAVHEMLHLGLPWTRDSDAWLQEGFVTYYQEVVRARAGFFDAREGWQRLHDGFARGRRSGGGRALAEESTHMDRTGAYRRVYWAGAALALSLDVRLRRSGERSLDDLMRLWHDRFAADGVHHTGMELMQEADSWLGGDACAALCHAALARTHIPDLNETYRSLGLRVQHGRLELVEGPHAHVRDAIMASSSR